MATAKTEKVLTAEEAAAEQKAKAEATVNAILAKVNKSAAKREGKRAKKLVRNMAAVKAAMEERKLTDLVTYKDVPSGHAFKVILADEHKVGVIHDGAILAAGRTTDGKVGYVRVTAKELAEFTEVMAANLTDK